MLKSYVQRLEDSDKDTGVLRDQIKVELIGKSGDTTSYEISDDEERDAKDFDEISEKQTTLHDYQLARDREMRDKGTKEVCIYRYDCICINSSS